MRKLGVKIGFGAVLCMATFYGCQGSGATASAAPTASVPSGTFSGSHSQGAAVPTVANLFSYPAARIAGLGTATSSDGKTWTVPAEVNYTSAPKAPDLYNECNDVTPANLSQVNLAALPTVTVDADGEVITAYIFADNYFEMYVNGVLVAVDPVPYTPFNSSVVRFRAKKPITYAFKLVDWEEHLGQGSEVQGPATYHAGDGGFIASFSDGTVTDATWKAQTFYIAPVDNLAHVVELPDGTRSSAAASTTPGCNGNCYAVHYAVPATWFAKDFNDTGWPAAVTYTEATVGVDNKPAYMNFQPQFSGAGAKFIWSSNLVLDNLVLVRKTIN